MKLTAEELKKISSKGSFLKERLDGKTLFLKGNIDEKRFELWKKKAGGSGGETAFLKRIYAEGITMERAKEISSDVTWDSDRDFPSWTGYINGMLGILPVDVEELKGKTLFQTDKYLEALKKQTQDNEKVFVEAKEGMLSILPFVYYGEKELIKRLGKRIELFSDKALWDMSQMLANGLYYLVHKTISERLRIFILRKESFGFLLNLKDEDSMRYMALFREDLLLGGWKEIFLEYPVLPRIMGTVINNWVQNMDELSSHLENDKGILEKEFNNNKKLGKAEGIKGSISDAHNKGKGVIILEFQSEVKIVYKPRNLGIDMAYAKLIDAMEDRGFPYKLKAPKALQFKNHGWIEFIEYKPLDSKEEAGSYYKRAGALLGLVYVLCGNDFHGENMIAHGEHPVLVDLETIIAYKMIQFNEDYEDMKETQNFIDLLQESVLGLGFLPIWLTAPGGICIDFGALTGSVTTSIPSFENAAMSVIDYKNELLEGFKRAYDFFMENKDKFFNDILKNLFDKSILRIIIRPTKVYAQMLYHTLSPEFLKDGFLYSIEIERFAPAFLVKVEDEKTKRLWDIFLSERDALEERDVPIFYGHADELHIRNDCNILSENYFADSALERVNNKIKGLSEDDKERQLDFIVETLKIYKKSCHDEGQKTETHKDLEDMELMGKEELLAEALDIYEQIMKKSIKVGDKNISWISYNHDLIHEKVMIGQAIASLYDGMFGISLFMSSLYSITGKEDIKRNALLLLGPFRESLRHKSYPMPVYRMQLGLGNGLGGIIKSLVMIGDYLCEEALYHDAMYLIDKIKPEQIKKEKNMDVLKGLIGLIPALVICHERFGHVCSLELAKLCGEQILKNKEKASETGFGCGTDGIIYGLYKLYSVTLDTKLYEAMLQMIKGNNGMNEEVPDKEGKMNLNGSLCSGTAGRGLMLLGILPVLEDAKIQIDIDDLIKHTLEYPMEFADHLCCGNSGRIDFLQEASLRLEKPELLKQANRRIRWMIKRKKEKGHFHIEGSHSNWVSNPSLFQGLSGIGYEMLRCIDAKRFQSVLY